MKKLLLHILFLVFMLMPDFIIKAQNQVDDSIDSSIARYETLCQTCMDLRTRIRQGEAVQKFEAEEVIGRFLALNKELKALENEMSEMQKCRFDAIGQWFSTGVKPALINKEPLSPLQALEANVYLGCVSQEQELKIELPELIGNRPVPSNVFFMASLNVPDLAYGLSMGYQRGRWGGYANFRSNYVFGNTLYSCQSDGLLSDGSPFWFGGQERRSNMLVTAGGIYELKSWLAGYVGAGYGWRTLARKDIDGEWAEVSDWSQAGGAFDAGLLFSWKQLVGSVGVSTIAFKTYSLTIGIGYKFSL